MSPGKRILIVGAGSVGKRHMDNLLELGCEVAVVDPRDDRLSEVASVAKQVDGFTSIDSALEAASFDAFFVCSPPSFHSEHATKALERGLPVYVEKPLTVDAVSATELARTVHRTNGTLLLGYTYRWWEPLLRARTWLQEGRIGRPLHVRGVMSAHLADWHPWERYQDFFMSSSELGGGALLDESHLFDLVLWLVGAPELVFARVERLSDLEIETDDNVDAWWSYSDGPRVWIHLDLYGRPHERALTIVGENGTVEWTFEPNRVRVAGKDQEWQEEVYSIDRNAMFAAAAQEFLEILDGARDRPSCTVEDGVLAMRVIEAMRESSRNGQVVRLA